MKLIPATADNLFVGCKVQKNKKEYFVYKINETTVWAGLAPTDDVLASVRKKLVKFSAKMQSIDAVKLNYVDLLVDEEIANRVKTAIPEGEETDKRFLKECCERQVQVWKKSVGNPKGAYKNMFVCETCDKQINPVKVENNVALFSVDYIMFYYDLITRKYKFFRKIG